MYTGIWQKLETIQQQKQNWGGFPHGKQINFRHKSKFWLMDDDILVETKFVSYQNDSYLDKNQIYDRFDSIF